MAAVLMVKLYVCFHDDTEQQSVTTVVMILVTVVCK